MNSIIKTKIHGSRRGLLAILLIFQVRNSVGTSPRG